MHLLASDQAHIITLKATRDIEPDEEIFYPYRIQSIKQQVVDLEEVEDEEEDNDGR
jgi:hypothetical protein